jgi:hypothetical protein
MSFIERILANPASKDVQLPPGFSAVGDDLAGVVAQFLRLVRYNRTVFGSYYSDMITALLEASSSS